MTFLQHEAFRETSYQRNIISKTLEAGREQSTTGSKHDGIEARRGNPKLDKNPNFGIMQVFDEAEGSGNIYRQESYRKDRNQANGPRSSRWLVAWVQNVVSTVQQVECLQKLEVSPCILTSGKTGGVLHVSWTCSQPCGARGVAVHASGAMQSDTRAATNLNLIGYCSVQLKINQVKISSDGKSTWPGRKRERNQVVDLECSRFSPRRCRPELVQIHGFRSVEVLLDTPPGSPKNCPESRGGSVRVQISLSRPFSFFMIKPRVPVIVKDSVVVGGRTIWADLLVVMLVLRVLCHIGRTTSTSVPIVGAKPAHARHVWGGLVFPRPRIQRVQGNPLFAGSGRLR
ncbi:hypothetical protein DY000_02020770 [Brassica cretica]|uniref:Uncharacterized protein n=1 Tax=Brassica cretica TaxID=69181 RepID=A0ABQ7E373_BRACR|nr:hypothetical protein DY000_02020770 [Brassica cretica]